MPGHSGHIGYFPEKVNEQMTDSVAGVFREKSAVADTRLVKTDTAECIAYATGINKKYSSRGETVTALHDVNLKLYKGEVLGFLGPNGAGKTTTIKILNGLIIPDEGVVSINGRNPISEAAALSQVGAVLEGNRNLYWRLTPKENIEYFGVLKGISRKQALSNGLDLLHRFGLSEKANLPVQTLSRGMQQKVAIAVSLVHKPAILLLDEPTLGLDVESALEVKRIISELAAEGHAILLTTHQLEVAEELSQRIAIIRQGGILIEALKETIMKRFSGTAYVVTLENPPSAALAEKLAASGASVSGSQVIVRSEDERDLYVCLEALSPAPIVKVERDNSTLSDIFLKLIKEHNNA